MHRTAFKRLKKNLLPGFMPDGFSLGGLMLCTVLLSACEPAERQYDYSIFAFGTLIDVTLYDVDKQLAESAFQQLQQSFDEYQQDWSPWTNGDLAQLNTKLQNPDNNTAIDVPEHLLPILKTSITLSEQSENFYNPAIGQLINLWQFHKYQDKDIRPPDDRKIQQLIHKNPLMSDLSFNEKNQLSNTNPALSLSLGAFAKGYAIALEIKRLKQLGIHHAIINAGGDLSVIGHHGDRAWNIGIRHPRMDGILASVEVNDNESVFTSGDYERFYLYQNKRYHHILDPRTGYPTTDAQSVTVLHEDAGLADAAATALFVAGRESWQRIAKKMGIDYVMLIDAAGDIHLTPAMLKRVKFLDKSPSSHIIVSEEL